MFFEQALSKFVCKDRAGGQIGLERSPEKRWAGLTELLSEISFILFCLDGVQGCGSGSTHCDLAKGLKRLLVEVMFYTSETLTRCILDGSSHLRVDVNVGQLERTASSPALFCNDMHLGDVSLVRCGTELFRLVCNPEWQTFLVSYDGLGPRPPVGG